MRSGTARAHRHLEWLSPSWSRSCIASWRQLEGQRPGHSAVRHAARRGTQSRPLRGRKSCSTDNADHLVSGSTMMVAERASSGAVLAQLYPETVSSAVDSCNTGALCVAMRQRLTEDVGRGTLAEAETASLRQRCHWSKSSLSKEPAAATKAQARWPLRYVGQAETPLY